MFWGKSFSQKASIIASIWVENTSIFSVLEQLVWQEGLGHCFSMGQKHFNLWCFGTIFFARKLEPLLEHG